jgi:hypothetical protein
LKVFGIDIVANDLCWIGLEGNSVEGSVLLQAPSRLKFPNAAVSEFGNLLSLKELVIARLSGEKFDRGGIVKASPAIHTIILKATRADLRKRFKSAEEFLSKLSQVSTPNWIECEDCFEAYGWRNFDWRVREIRKKDRTEAIVEKKRVGNYKRCHSADDLSAAFRFVESA